MRKVDLDTASSHYGLSKDALRKRIKRGTIEAERDKAGKWWVVIRDETDIPEDEPDASSDLLDQLREQIAFLERQLENRGEEIRRRDRIIS